jgi:hypothetical protein
MPGSTSALPVSGFRVYRDPDDDRLRIMRWVGHQLSHALAPPGFGERFREGYYDAEGNRIPRQTLYVRRDLLNGEELTEWAKAAGFKTVSDKLHVTIAYSKAPVDWRDVPRLGDDAMTVSDGERSLERLGDKGEATVLRFESNVLADRHREIRRAGAWWDYPDYKCHLTISWDAADIDIAGIHPFPGALRFGPEVWEEIDDKWKDGHTEKYSPDQPRAEDGKWTSGGGGDDGKPDFSQRPDVTEEEHQAVYDYLNDSTINEHLRSGDYMDTSELDSVANKSPLRTNEVVWRGMHSDGYDILKEHVGKEYTDRGFMSTTRDRTIAERYDYVVRVNLPEGTRAIDMDLFDEDRFDPDSGTYGIPSERELVVHRGSRWRISEDADGLVLDYVPVKKYSPDQARDENGRWVEGAGGEMEWSTKPAVDENAVSLGPPDHDHHEGIDGAQQLQDADGNEYTWVPRHTVSELEVIHESAMQDSLTDEETDALWNYTGADVDGAAEINMYLRDGDPEHDRFFPREAVALLDSALAKARLAEDTTVYRGMDYLAWKRLADQVGQTYTDPGYMSTTLDRGFARQFGDSRSMLEIKLPKGAPAMPLHPASLRIMDEARGGEVLVMRGQRFRINSVERDGDNGTIKMELIT